MVRRFIYRFVVAAVICGVVRAENGKEGDSCVTSSGESGACTDLAMCPSAQHSLRQGTLPTICFFSGTSPVVCCPQGRSRRSAPACPPLPPAAVNGQKTGQKARDKCLELAELVHPCKPSSQQGAPGTRERSCAQDSAPLIPGRYNVVPEEFPHMVAVGYGEQNNIQWFCGGTLISDRWVLTAAQCSYLRNDGEPKYLRLGGGDRNSIVRTDHLFSVAEIVVHPNYTHPVKYNDIALLRLDRPASFSSLVRPACLHTGPPGTAIRAIATGWGMDQYRGNLSNSLRKVILDIFSHEECSLKNPPKFKLKNGLNEATQLCAGPKTGHADTCQGDSGGPLQVINKEVDCTYLVIGLVSFGIGCGTTGQPAVYTRVAAFIPWIESVAWP